jgi:hypothetical protein
MIDKQRDEGKADHAHGKTNQVDEGSKFVAP